MPYVVRDDDTGVVLGAFARPQPGFAEEWLEPDDAAVLLFERGPLVEQVRLEAERRIANSIIVNGRPFRTGSEDRQRLQEMIDRFESGRSVSQTFRTAAGVEFTWTRAAEPQAIANAVGDYVADILEASAVLQRNPPDDYADDRHWPTPPSVTV